MGISNLLHLVCKHTCGHTCTTKQINLFHTYFLSLFTARSYLLTKLNNLHCQIVCGKSTHQMILSVDHQQRQWLVILSNNFLLNPFHLKLMRPI